MVSANTTNFANSVMNDMRQAAERLRRAGQLKGMRASCRRRPSKRGVWPGCLRCFEVIGRFESERYCGECEMLLPGPGRLRSGRGLDLTISRWLCATQGRDAGAWCRVSKSVASCGGSEAGNDRPRTQLPSPAQHLTALEFERLVSRVPEASRHRSAWRLREEPCEISLQ